MNIQLRENTFYSVRRREPSLRFQECAEAGFVYQASTVQGESDRIQCVYCPLILTDWRHERNLFLTHAKYFSTCIHLMACKGRASIRSHTHENVDQYRIINDGIGQNHLNPLLHAGGKEHRSQTLYITKLVGPTYESPRGVAYTEPIHRSFSDYNKRIQSLIRFRRVISEFTLNQFAGAGFFWPGNRDDLVCYYCAKGKNVCEVLVNEDPYEMHVKLSVTCFHLIMEKGEEFIHHVASGNMHRFPVEEENLTTEGPGSTGHCANCGQIQGADTLMRCIHCERLVCAKEQCLEPPCCTFPNRERNVGVT